MFGRRLVDLRHESLKSIVRNTASAAAVIAASAFAAGASAQSYSAPAGTPAHIRSAVESAARPAEDRDRDAGRKPAQVLTLAGLQSGDHVMELGSFGNYYTRILLGAVGSDGRVDMIDVPRSEPFGGEGSRALAAENANATYSLRDYEAGAFPQGADVAFLVLHYHDLQPWGVDMAELNSAVFDALAPGGRYVVIDHKAEDGSGWRDAESVHRIGAEVIVEEVTAAGFELSVDSDLLANPDDDRSGPIFAPGSRGATDRALLIFTKP